MVAGFARTAVDVDAYTKRDVLFVRLDELLTRVLEDRNSAMDHPPLHE